MWVDRSLLGMKLVERLLRFRVDKLIGGEEFVGSQSRLAMVCWLDRDG